MQLPRFLFVLACFFVTSVVFAQEAPRTSVGRCEGCEEVFNYGDTKLSSVATLPDYATTEPKLKLTGVVYQPDGKTPAEGVILYIYHTDRTGVYPARGQNSNGAQMHGSIRGWAKTGKDGRYTFLTFRPAGYPGGRAPEHVHVILAEPSGKYYWVNDFFFDDDRNLTDRERNPRELRGGGSGVVVLRKEGVLLVAERDIILGKGVSEYE